MMEEHKLYVCREDVLLKPEMKVRAFTKGKIYTVADSMRGHMISNQNTLHWVNSDFFSAHFTPIPYGDETCIKVVCIRQDHTGFEIETVYSAKLLKSIAGWFSLITIYNSDVPTNYFEANAFNMSFRILEIIELPVDGDSAIKLNCNKLKVDAPEALSTFNQKITAGEPLTIRNITIEVEGNEFGDYEFEGQITLKKKVG